MKELSSLHRAEYGSDPEVVVSAPGVINLMGEHTDYNEGLVLLGALNRTLHVAVSKRKDNSLRFYAADFGERKRTSIANLKYKREDRWANKPKGVIWALLKEGYEVKGMDMTISSKIPQGNTLGTSAALEVASSLALKTLFDFSFSKRDVVEFAYAGETIFNGVDKPLTDFYGCAFSKKGFAMYIDVRSTNFEFIPMNLRGYKLLITIANVPHVPVASEISLRKEACKECVDMLQAKRAGSSLRDYSSTDLQSYTGRINENTKRVCMHVLSENERVRNARRALIKKEVDEYGKLLNRSHESLRDNYEMSCPEVDWLVKRAWEIDGVLGSRLIGKGFGIGTCTLIKNESIRRYEERLDEYEHIFGFHPETFVFEASGGTAVTYKSRKRKRA